MNRDDLVNSARQLDNEDRLSEGLSLVESAYRIATEDEEILGLVVYFLRRLERFDTCRRFLADVAPSTSRRWLWLLWAGLLSDMNPSLCILFLRRLPKEVVEQTEFAEIAEAAASESLLPRAFRVPRRHGPSAETESMGEWSGNRTFDQEFTTARNFALRGETDQCDEWLVRAESHQIRCRDTIRLRCWVCIAKRQLGRASESLNDYRTLVGEVFTANLLEGEIALARGRAEEASIFFESALRQNPVSEPTIRRLVHVYLRRIRWLKAAHSFRSYVKNLTVLRQYGESMSTGSPGGGLWK